MRLKDSDLWRTPPEVCELVRLLCPYATIGGYVDMFGDRKSELTRMSHVCYDAEDSVFEADLAPFRRPLVANPPWSPGWLAACVAKMDEAKHSPTQVLIAPLNPERKWARRFNAGAMLIPPGRLSYIDPETGERPGSPKTSSCVYVRGRFGIPWEWMERNGWEAWERWTQ